MNEPVLVFASPLQEERPLLSQARRSCSIAVVAVSVPALACSSIALLFSKKHVRKQESQAGRRVAATTPRPLTEPGAIYSIY